MVKDSRVILVDQNIPFANKLFDSLGDVRYVNGREVTEKFENLEEVWAMVIRSVTKVTPGFLERAKKLRVIGIATSGTDNVDAVYAGNSGVRVVSALGSNADAVADHILYALMHITNDEDSLKGKTAGIIGYGNCGSRVAKRAEGFGLNVLKYDPLLRKTDGNFKSDSLEEVLSESDFVTMHVPLTKSSESRYDQGQVVKEYPTLWMIGKRELSMMKETAYFFNASRGPVVDSDALLYAVREGWIKGMVLDVYENEPEPKAEMIERAIIATPHIAGYAAEARIRGAIEISIKMHEILGKDLKIDPWSLLKQEFSAAMGKNVRITSKGNVSLDADNAVRTLMADIYNIQATSDALKATLGAPNRGNEFDRLRREYRRNELSRYYVALNLPPGLKEEVVNRLNGFGVKIMERQKAHYILSV
ncbi:4-phosphoerythronate dehydrogenase [Candidatus Woesearchaeota archaeon]|nr:4-phosphoerythronate dehydrogenase [Candidatus Woesearchaeota archaeon]